MEEIEKEELRIDGKMVWEWMGERKEVKYLWRMMDGIERRRGKGDSENGK